jgi:hypothetical protein
MTSSEKCVILDNIKNMLEKMKNIHHEEHSWLYNATPYFYALLNNPDFLYSIERGGAERVNVFLQNYNTLIEKYNNLMNNEQPLKPIDITKYKINLN